MISVAMAVYNGEKYLEKQLESILCQSRLPTEIVVVDDFSTDSSCEILERFKKNQVVHFQIIRHSSNKGYIFSFREALSKCRGEYVFLCDQDDIWMPNKIEIMYAKMQQDCKIKLMACSFYKIDAQEKRIVSRNLPFSSNNNLIRKRIEQNACALISSKEVVTYNISMGCTYLIRKEIVDDYLKIDSQLPHDWCLCIIASLNDGLYFLNVPLVYYRIHSNNTIGLTRKYDVSNRLQASITGKQEKKYILDLVNEYCGDVKLCKYIDKLIRIFSLRQQILLDNKISIKCIYLILISLFKHGIVQSSLVDILSILKDKEKKC